MGSRIRVLPEKVANMIAAGEVVDRPASVVKELVENSLDSGGSRIIVEVTKGGAESISVADDGSGMSRDDALLAFERHATSKLADASDLEKILTLGFRGEALPSIASVSRLELTTKEKDALAGTHIHLEGGVIKDVQDVGCPPGTLIVVRDLFFNLPARKKYLKTVSTEMGHIAEAVSHRGNANMDVQFQLVHNGRKVLELPATDNLQERIAGTIGSEVAKEMLKVEYRSEMLSNGNPTPANVYGYIAPPTVTRPSASQIITYVNGRHIKNRMLFRSVGDAYRTVLPDRRYPVVVLFLEIDPALVDVNVHPAKVEVKFLKENDIYSLVGRAVKNSLNSANLTPRFKLGEKVEVEDGVSTMVDASANANAFPYGKGVDPPGRSVGYRIEPEGGKFPSQKEAFPKRATGFESNYDSGPTKVPSSTPLTPDLGSGSKKDLTPLSELIYIGQAFDTYIIAQGKEGLYIIDQHTAHERVLYEQLLVESKNGRPQTQRLLLPISLELTPKESGIISPYLPTLREIGFDLEELGKDTFVLKAFPAALSKTDVKRGMRGVVDEIVSRSLVGKITEEHDSIIAMTSCRSAIKAGDRMLEQEAKWLIGRLDAASMSYTCVHGRPTMISIELEEIERKFKRR